MDRSGVETKDDSVLLLKVDSNFESHQLLTPPSSADALSIFSPHTPLGSPLHHGSSSYHSSSSKVVHSESSTSLSSSGLFSPHTPQSQSPALSGTPVHAAAVAAAVAAAAGSHGGDIRGGLNFAVLELKTSVPVIVSWAASPNKFTVSFL